MTRSKEETDRLIAMAERAWENAPTMPPEDAARLREKWRIDAQSWTPEMFTPQKGDQDQK